MYIAAGSSRTSRLTFSRPVTLMPIQNRMLSRKRRANKRTIEDDIHFPKTSPILYMCSPNLKLPASEHYQFFRFEQLRFSHDEIFKLLKIAISHRLRSTDLGTVAILTRSGQPRPFSSVRENIFDTINVFIGNVKLGNPLHVNVGTSSEGTLYDALFKEYRFCGMLESIDFDCIDRIPFFIDAIVN